MKSTGIVRRVDELGRVVIPKEIRKNMSIEKKDPMEIYVSDDCIILKKYEPACVFCGEAGDIVAFKSKNICQNCLESMQHSA